MTRSVFQNMRSPAFSQTLLKRGKSLLRASSFLAYLSGMAVFGAFAFTASDLPDPNRLWENQRPVSVQIVDRLGRDLLVRGATAAPRVDIDDLPFHIPLTILAVEDRRFQNHIGIDVKALTRAMVQNVKASSYVQGGSTLTQQLSKNVFLSPDKTLRRKAQELLMAVWLERSFTKDEILELYLSKVYFGSGAWGIEAASQRYFNKPAANMNISETALLAGLLKAPSALNPVNHPSRAAQRTKTVLDVLQAQDLIDADMYAQSLHHPIKIYRPQSDNSAQYFVDWIWPEIERVLGDVPTQDIVVQTTLDREAQRAAQKAVLDNLDPERKADQSALISLDGTGAVLAMVGGASYSESQFNRATQAQRQPGSAFKPFVYLAGFEAGLTPWDKRIDQEITLTNAQDAWTPKNFSQDFAGEVTLEQAFTKSINTIAVQIGEDVGRARVIDTANRFGLHSLQAVRSLSLGSQVTTPLMLTKAYLPFASFGQSREPFGILSISTANGTPLYDGFPSEPQRVIHPEHLAQMNRLMTRNVSSGTGRRAYIAGRDIGGKTGTTNDFRDAWFIGYAPDIVTGVWVGNDTNEPMKSVTGGSIPAQIFQDYMSDRLKDAPVAQLLIASEPEWVRQKEELESLLSSIEEALP